MPKSAARGIAEVAITIAVAVAVLYLLGSFFDFLDQYVPAVASYRNYIEIIIAGVLAFGVATIILRIIKQVIDEYTKKAKKPVNLRGVFIILRILIYAVSIAWFLTYIGVSFEGALVGGAIGGIIIGIAVQSIITSLFSGLMVSADGLVVPGESVSLYSYLYGETLTGEVIDVRLLHTILRNYNGQIFRVPNSALLNSTVFTRLRDKGLLKYVFQATVGLEVPSDVLMDLAKKDAIASAKGFGLKEIDMYIFTKFKDTNALKIAIRFDSLSNLNEIISAVNLSLEKAYRQLRQTEIKKGQESLP